MDYTHEEVKAIIKFVLEEERLLDLAEKVQPIEEKEQNVKEYIPEIIAEEEKDIAVDPEPVKAKKVPKKAGPEKKKIDHGKIIACWKAGRSVAWIADEMRCAQQTVYNHIEMEKKKGQAKKMNTTA